MKIELVTDDAPITEFGVSEGIAANFQRMVYTEEELVTSVSNLIAIHKH